MKHPPTRRPAKTTPSKQPFFQKAAAVRTSPAFFPGVQPMADPNQIPEQEEEILQTKATPAMAIQQKCAACAKEPQTSSALQPKLTIGQPHDRYEQEADRVADHVVNQISTPQSTVVQPAIAPRITPLIMRQGEGKATAHQPTSQKIQQARGQGTSLDQATRSSMEQAFGADFNGVKIHADSNADQLNRSLNARAFTTGQDIFFRQGEYQPGSQTGQRLLAHELTHVLQQNGNHGEASEIQRTHFSSGYTSWYVAPHMRQAGEAQTYSLEFQLNVAMELALFSEANTDDIDVSAVQDLMASTLNQFGGGWRDIGGQRVYVNWTLNWVSPSQVTRGRAIGIAVLPESVFTNSTADGIFMHEDSTNRIILRGTSAERVLRPATRAERRNRRARREDRLARERATRRFGHEVTHEVGHAVGLSHRTGTVMNDKNTERVDRFLTGEQIRQIVLNITSNRAALPPWLRGEAETTTESSP